VAHRFARGCPEAVAEQAEVHERSAGLVLALIGAATRHDGWPIDRYRTWLPHMTTEFVFVAPQSD